MLVKGLKSCTVLSGADPGSGFFPHPESGSLDTGVKKASDPGSGSSATLFTIKGGIRKRGIFCAGFKVVGTGTVRFLLPVKLKKFTRISSFYFCIYFQCVFCHRLHYFFIRFCLRVSK
jgi:hypothetical protein